MSTHPARSIRNHALAGACLVAVSFGGFAAAAALIDMPGAVMAAGAVKPDGHRRTVQHLEGGIVADIRVREGDRVRAGQTLLVLDTTRTRAALSVLEANLAREGARKARLEAEADLTPAMASVAGPFGTSEARLFEAGRRALDGQVAMLEARSRQLGERLAGLEAQARAARLQRDSRLKERAGLARLADKAIIPRAKMDEIDREIGRLEGILGNAEAEMAANRAAQAELRLQAEQARVTYRQAASDALSDVIPAIAEIEEKIRVARDSLDRAAILAPVDGTVQDLRIFTEGGVVSPAEPLLDIVPSSDRLVVEARIPVTAVDDLRPGLDAELRFPGLSGRNLPLVQGRLARLSADAVTDRNAGISFYAATIEVDAARLPDRVAQSLQPGLPVEAVVITAPRSLGDYLFEPFRDMLRGAMSET